MTDIIHTIEVVPPGHHQTNAGILPNEWTSRPLCSVVDEITETARTKKIETVSISAGIGFVNQAEKFGKELSGKQYEKYTVLHQGDFSYNKGNSNLYPQGCIYRLNDRTEAAVPNVFESFRVSDGNPDYYEQLFISGFLNRQLYSRINRGVRDDGLLNLRGKDFYSCEVPCPPLAEQERIAEILMQCDKVIDLKRKRIEAEKKKKKWLVDKLIVIPHKAQRLGAVCTVGDVAEVVGRIGFRGYTKEDLVSAEEGAMSMSPSNMSDGEIDFSLGSYISWKKYNESPEIMLQKDDILFVKTGSTYGKCAQVRVLSEPATINPQLAIIRASKVNPDYLVKVLESDIVQRRVNQIVVGGAVPTLTQEEIRNFEISIPSPVEQHKISVILLQQDDLIKKLNEEVHLLQSKKKSLMQLLLTGIVRTKA